MIRLIISVILMSFGLIVFAVSAYGNLKYSDILNRMQVASVADTSGVLLVLLSLIVYNGFDILGIKLILVIILLWFANPVGSHYVSKTEVIVDEEIAKKVEVIKK